ncbi:MAG: rhomboid family intramembrane serine protease [bacterium]
MFPIRDENPTYHTSVMTFAIIGLNVLSWIFLQGFGRSPVLAKSVCQFGLIPAELLGLLPAGTRISVGRGVLCVIENDSPWITVITSMFMHGSWFHLIGNLWFLAVFGDNVEDVMGPVKFFMFYLLCGIVAGAVQVAMNPSSPIPMVGASGAISGVMGAYAILFPKAPVHLLIFIGFFITTIVVPAFIVLGYWFLLQLLGGFMSTGTGGVAFGAHIGGFLAGIFLLKLFCQSDRIEECRLKRGTTDKIIKRRRR